MGSNNFSTSTDKKDVFSVASIGIVHKFINYGKGWKPRLILLHADRLVYYKVEDGLVQQLLASLHDDTDIRVVSSHEKLHHEVLLRRVSSKGSRSGRSNYSTDAQVPKPRGELQLQATFMTSSTSDKKKFVLQCGKELLHCKADSEEERDAWMAAISQAKDALSFGGRCNCSGSTCIMCQPVSQVADEVCAKLAGQWAVVPEAQAEVRRALVEQQLAFRAHLQRQAAKERAMQRRLMQLQSARQHLEGRLTEHLEQLRMIDQGGRMHEVASAGDLTAYSSVTDDFYECHSILQDAGEWQEPEPEPEPPQEPQGDYDDGADDDDVVGDLADNSGPIARRPTVRDLAEMRLSSDLFKSSNDQFFDALSTFKRSVSVTRRSGGQDLAASDQANRDQWLLVEPIPHKRHRLPDPIQSEPTGSLFSMLANAAGKDLSRMALPVYTNEPLSALQKWCEELQYCSLLETAAKLQRGSLERLLHVAAFAVSGYAGGAFRHCKPFNPLLGETFEFVCPERKFRFIGEKVVHHPCVLAMHAEGAGWVLEGDADMRNRFKVSYIEIAPAGIMRVTFADGEAYEWNKVTTYITNLMRGLKNVSIEHSGTMKVVCTDGGACASIQFKERTGMFDRSPPRSIQGDVTDASGAKMSVSLSGIWNQRFTAVSGGQQQHLWQVDDSKGVPNRYNMTPMAVELNDLTDDVALKLPPTDSRFRPDQRLLERGLYDQAEKEKQRLEHKQRLARQASEKGEAAAFAPRWFKHVPGGAQHGESLVYGYAGGYWEARAAGQLKHAADNIFA